MTAPRFALAAAITLLAGFAPAQQSTALVDAPVLVADHQTRFQKLADINGDGYLDAFSAWWASDSYNALKVAAFLNDGNGALAQAWVRSVSISPTGSGTNFWATAAGDVDANGLDDFVLGAGRNLWVFMSEPGGGVTPTLGAWTTGGPLIRGLALVEVSGSPYPEIAVLHGDLTILRYDWGISGWLAPTVTMPVGAVNGELQAAELNGDGELDLLAWDATRVLMIPVVAGIPQTPVEYVHGLGDPKARAGDLDGDGDWDVVVFDMGTYIRLRRTGPASFVQEGPYFGGPARYLFDLDQDGDLDGVCCGGGGGGGPYPVRNITPSTFRIALNDGQGNFASAIEFPGLGSERLAGAGDLDHDGDLDLVAGRCVYYQSEAGIAGLPRTVSVDPLRAESFADLDGDSDPDIAPGTATSRNAGDGTFSTFVPVLPAPPPGRTFHGTGYPGDFDGDGDLDLVVEVRFGGVFDEMRLLRNAGGGSFVDSGPAAAGGLDFTYPAQTGGPQARHALARDADGDGDVDLVVRALPVSGQTKIFWNDGQGVFSAGPAWTSGLVVHVADLNGDGVPELIGWWNGYLAYWPGLGGGTFGSVQYLDHQSPSTLVEVVGIGDADADGDLDIVGNGSTGAFMLRNPGTLGGWPGKLSIFADTLSSAEVPRGAVLVDVDDDGLLDVIAYPVGHATQDAPPAARVLRRRSDNTGYEPPVIQVLTPTAVLDVDGDGDEDMCGTVLYKGRHFDGVAGGMRRQIGGTIPGAGDVSPTLGADGPFRVGEQAELIITGACGGASGHLDVSYVSDSPPVFGGGTHAAAAARERFVSQILFTTNGTAGVAGEGRWSLPYIVPEYAAGRTKRYRAILDDPWSPSGMSQSNQLLITYGP